MPKVVFYECPSEEQTALKSEIEKSSGPLRIEDCIFTTEKLGPKSVSMASNAIAVSVFIYSRVDKDAIATLPPSVRLITTRSTGADHIDVAAANSRGMSVVNVPAYGSRTVAEYAFALILGLSRKLLDASHRMKSGMTYNVYGLMGFDLEKKVLGVVGMGRIGQNVAKIAKGFDMEVLAFDPHQDQEAAVKIGFKYVSLEELLSLSDIITLHLPLTPQTKSIINMNNIGMFKKGSLLINTARGEVCDTEAILYGIKNGILAGAGLDVVEGERRLKDDMAHMLTKLEDELFHPEQRKRLSEYRELSAMPNVFITPHIAYYTKEAQSEISRVTIASLNKVVSQ